MNCKENEDSRDIRIESIHRTDAGEAESPTSHTLTAEKGNGVVGRKIMHKLLIHLQKKANAKRIESRKTCLRA